MPRSFELLIRRYIPSISRLTYNPVFASLLRVADVLPGGLWKEFRKLPPNHFRCRIGVGNRLLTNQVIYLTRGYAHWMHALAEGYVTLSSDIVEIGCGCGRRTQILRDFRFHETRYSGRYLGIDIDAAMVTWCRRNFDERFEFAISTHNSASYVGGAKQKEPYIIPRDANSVDYVFGTSLLTHLLEDEIRNYFEEAGRILRPGSWMMFSCFCIDRNPKLLNQRYTFSHRIRNAYVESLQQPEAAVAYESDFLVATGEAAGFEHVEILSNEQDVQHAILARMPA